MNKSKHIAALAIGFILIAIVALFTFFHPFSKNNEEKSVSPKKFFENQNVLKPMLSRDLLAKMRSNEKIIILDIRPREEFLREHIIDSINIPFSDLESKLDDLEKEREYIILDSLEFSENLNAVSNFFDAQKIKNAYYLSGGFFSWKNDNNPAVSAGDPASFIDQSKVTYINSDALKTLIANELDNFLIIDVRKNNSFSEGHIPGALNIFLDDLESRRHEFTPGKKIILYDNDGLWAFQGAVRLFDMGFFNVKSLSGGLNSWKQEGYEITK